MAYLSKSNAGGKVALPADLRREFGLKAGDVLVFERDGDVMLVRSHAAVIREAQAAVRRFVPVGVSLSDELLADRRAETRG